MSDADLNNKQLVSQICFNCDFCGKQIRVPSVHAGKKGKCPQCKGIILVPCSAPSSPQANTPINPGPELDLVLQPNPPHDRIAADKPKDQQYEMLRQSEGLPSLQPTSPPQRKFPWLIDIFLYPANLHGIIFLAIVVLIPWMFQLVIEFLVGLMGVFAVLVIFINLIVDIVILMFAYWFLAECICDSAEGNLRVPNTADNTPGLAEMGLRLIRIFVCLVVYLVPASLYYRYTYRFDLPFQIIAGCGIFLYPMALLGVLMFDSIRGLNPLIVIPSLFGAFFQYCGLIVFVCAIIFLFTKAREFLLASPLLWLFIRAIEVYLLMVVAHLLGRFYFKYQEKLNWDV
jgi:hypothetical protein